MEQHKQHDLFIGRWQPFHNGHMHIIQKQLEESGGPILIAVRDTPVSDKDPLTTTERVEMINKVFEGQPVEVIVIPDIKSVSIGRNVGYDLIEHSVPEDIACISATDIRKKIGEDDESWKDCVPEAVAKFIDTNGLLCKEGRVIWLTGLSGAGKTTLATSMLQQLNCKYTVLLDGDIIRSISKDLGFSKEDRDENRC